MPSQIPLTVRDKRIIASTMLFMAGIVVGLWMYSNRDQTESPRSSWKRMGAASRYRDFSFTIAVPQGIHKYHVQGIDSEVGAMRNQRIDITYDFGWYPTDLSSFSNVKGCKEEKVEIDGKEGTTVICEKPHAFYVGVSVREVCGDDFHFCISAESTDETAHAVAVEIMKSIRFGK